MSVEKADPLKGPKRVLIKYSPETGLTAEFKGEGISMSDLRKMHRALDLGYRKYKLRNRGLV